MFQCSTLTINNRTFVAHVQVITKQKSMSELWELGIYGSWCITIGYSKTLLYCRENLQDRKCTLIYKNVSFLVYLLLIKKLKVICKMYLTWSCGRDKICARVYTALQTLLHTSSKCILQQQTVHVCGNPWEEN